MSTLAAFSQMLDRRMKGLRGMVEYVTNIAMNSDGTATMNGAKTDDDDGNPLEAAVAWHLGFYSRPLDGANGIVLKADGKGGTSFLIGWRNAQYEITLQKGELAMANEAGAVVKCKSNGDITEDTPAGQKVLMQGGGAPVARKNDTLTAGVALATWAGAVETALNSIATGAVPTLFATAAGLPGQLGKIATGSSKVEADTDRGV